MRRLSKTLKRTVIVESAYLGKPKLAILRELEEAYREMVEEVVKYAVENNAKSMAKLHKALYKRLREKYPEMPTRLVKGAIADAARRAKSFLRLKRLGRAYTDKPEVKRVTITYPDNQDWRLQGDAILLKTHRGWLEVPLRIHKHYIRYRYGGWRLGRELRFKITGRTLVFYLVFERELDIEYEPVNVVAVDVNENNVTVAIYKNAKLAYLERIETSLGRIVIAYTEKRRKIMKGHHWSDRCVRKRLKKLAKRERNRKLDILRKTARRIIELARKYNAVVVVGDIAKHKKRVVERQRQSALRHRLHQWSVVTLVRLLQVSPVHVELVDERGTSSIDPFSNRRIWRWLHSVTRVAARGGHRYVRVRVYRLRLRLGPVDGYMVERDFIGAINIGARWLWANGFHPDVRGVAFPANGAHEAPATLVSGGRGTNPALKAPVIIKNHSKKHSKL
ncbi:MAG: IS200/IS605 family accessory protein TnpB-related protein [Desulfurococcales archaeon]|nr:IS200/IS605 family accessory protein TnpB-related protein [Desulfurococcales archaeon]